MEAALPPTCQLEQLVGGNYTRTIGGGAILRLLGLQKRLVSRDDASAEVAFVAIQAQAAVIFRTERAEIPELSDAGPPPAEHMPNLALAFPGAVEEGDPNRLKKAKRPFATERAKK